MSQIPFIIYNPESETSGQSSARVHAARTSYWRRREQKRLGPDHVTPSPASPIQGPLLEGVASEDSLSDALLPLQQTIFSQSESPSSVLAQNRIDPFDCMPAGRLPQNVRTALEYAWEVAFTAGTSTTQLNETAPITEFWKHECTNSPTLLHMQLQLAIEMPMAQTLDREGSLAEIAAIHKSTAYRLMRMEIQEFEKIPNNIPTDALILALFSSNFLCEPLSIIPESCHPASPLATTQLLHVYGRIPMIPGHTRALHNLTEKRGGLGNLRQGGIADLIQLHDLRTASQTGEKPLFPWIGPPISIAAARLLGNEQPLAPGLEPLRDVNGQLWEILRSAREVTAALDQHQRSGCLHPKLQDLVIAANSVQHALCSLPSARLLDGSAANNSLYEICRLAGLVYTDMVLFPLPACTGVKLRLADDMRVVLGGLSGSAFLDGQSSALVLWAISLATIAASFSEQRRWFVSTLTPLVTKLVVPFDFTCFRELMRNYLWWDPVFDEPASTMWNEICTEMEPTISTQA